MIELDSVPGCLLHKRRALEGDGNLWSLCMEQCAGCGWNEDEQRIRKQRIADGEMVRAGSIELLIVDGNGHKHV